MFSRIVVLLGLVLSSTGAALEVDDEDYHPWNLQLASATRDKNLASIHALAEVSTRGKIGFSYSKGEDALKIFQEPNASMGLGYSLYSSDRLPYQMFAVKYQQTLLENFWMGLSIGRLEVHETKNLASQSCSYCDSVIYLNSTNGSAMDIDISKTYGSFSLGWQTKIMPHFSLGFIAFDYIVKGDSSGVSVNSVNSDMSNERARLHAAMIRYARKDYFQPLQLMVVFDF